MNLKPRVITHIDVLRSTRSSTLTALFSGIALRKTGINIGLNSVRGNIIISVSDGREGGTNFVDWRFKTYVDDIKASYYESWNAHSMGRYYLERAYFHLYKMDVSAQVEKEYILLHCDASEPDGSPHSKYKQSPHLHFESAPQPLPKAHIALYNGGTSEVLKSLDTFNLALNDCIGLLDSQVLKLH